MVDVSDAVNAGALETDEDDDSELDRDDEGDKDSLEMPPLGSSSSLGSSSLGMRRPFLLFSNARKSASDTRPAVLVRTAFPTRICSKVEDREWTHTYHAALHDADMGAARAHLGQCMHGGG